MSRKLKNDKYRKARGGYSRFLNIFCEKCSAKALLYQKDGPGPLKRLYLDRIFTPEILRQSQKSLLKCSKCKSVLGVPYVYPKERRRAFRLFAGAVTKKIIKSPPKN